MSDAPYRGSSATNRNHAIGRWARFGSYYAMFPVDFAFEKIERHSRLGELVIDPFAGRGTSVFAAAALGRIGVGVEINPVGWVYGKAKIAPGKKETVIERLAALEASAPKYSEAAKKMPPFFQMCFHSDVLSFLLAARKELLWKTRRVDATLMAFIVHHLHGKKGDGMSNQMRQTKAMSPGYSMRWWKDNDKENPPSINPGEFLRSKIEWRYAKESPRFNGNARLYLGDSATILSRVRARVETEGARASLLFTSPPYWSLVNYHYDQWLRLWLLGGEEFPRYLPDKNRGRFLSQTGYRALLRDAFSKCAAMMTDNATVYVRTDIREFTRKCTREVLQEVFPHHSVEERESASDSNQTQLFQKNENSTEQAEAPQPPQHREVDIILSKNRMSRRERLNAKRGQHARGRRMPATRGNLARKRGKPGKT